MAEVTIHGFAQSTYTRTARIAAIEKGVEYQLLPIEYGQKSHFALHPFGKMPILTHKDRTIFESLAILAYLDSEFEGQTLFPEDRLDFVQAMSVISAAIDYAYRPVVHLEIGPDGASEADLTTVRRTLDWLEGLLGESRFLAGEAMTAADLVVAPMIDFHLGKVTASTTFEKRPSLAKWYEMMTGRPSFAATRAEA